MVRTRDPTHEDVIDKLITVVELTLFEEAQMHRLGYVWRGVPDPIHQRGHVGLLAQVCRWFNLELGLGYDELLILQLALDHDFGQLVKPKSNPLPDKLPSNRLRVFIEQFVLSGASYQERIREYAKDRKLLAPLFEEIPKVWKETDRSLNLYFRRPRTLFFSMHNEAWFLHNTGKVLDAHLGLWYCRKGIMDINARNIRSFVERMASRIRDETARLYWEKVKARYRRELSQVYRSSTVLLLQ